MKLDCETLFSQSAYARKYAFLENEQGARLKLSWRSDLITPDIKPINDAHSAIGVDTDFAIFKNDLSQVVTKLSLQYNYADTKVLPDHIIVATELELLVLNATNFSLEKIIDLPEIYEDLSFGNKGIFVKCLYGDVYPLSVVV